MSKSQSPELVRHAGSTPDQHSIGLLNSIFVRHWLAPDAVALWTDTAALRAWIVVELALAKAQEEPHIALIPAGTHDAMQRHLDLKYFDIRALQTDIAHTMHPFVPVLHQLERMLGAELAGYLHWGATTQNIFDTADAWRLKQNHTLLMPSLKETLVHLADMAITHKDTPQAGRTHGQHALPITFGFKLAAWRAELRRHHDRLSEAAGHCFWATMGGAVGTFSAMQGKGQQVQDQVAVILGLVSMDIPMRSSSDGVAHYTSLLGLMAATTEKIANEVIFLQRSEIAEVGESFHRGKVGSSTMSQKRNPQAAMNLVCMSRLLRSRATLLGESMIQHDEGDAACNTVIGLVLPELAVLSVSIARELQKLLKNLATDAAVMTRNLRCSNGLIVSEAVMMALAPHIGRHEAHKVLYDVSHDSQDSGKSLVDLISEDPRVKPFLHLITLPALVNPENYLGESTHQVEHEIQRLPQEARHDRA